ncbi:MULTISPECIES: alpha/beta fold hydrolase [unclassified Duganella]|uniref:alpha/beta fold hydrolase n=1 Tax=unclassified Duganella TaxID=2636909 RepID=UPI0006F6C4A9|nr:MULTISPECIES: alpha/beta hydrolase [unclassified Duganella]KQV53875.1 alpha/beta hydrolase [Duganella sp. Root336D2]KRB83571.1 alpha/beta hydrolase [Duganella sp. Root198D2]
MSALKKSIAAAAGTLALAGAAAQEIDYVKLSPDITLRRMVVKNPAAKGTVLFLHGFPETMLTWRDLALDLGRDYEVHAFDWPGYGQSSRPSAAKFAYAPRDYAQVVKAYIDKAGIDRSTLVIYATDIGALPPLLAALEQPDIARKIIAGDFAPFDRPQYMSDRLRSLKEPQTAQVTRTAINQNRNEIIENTFRRGLEASEQFNVPADFTEDMLAGWTQGRLSTGDAFYHYYSHFTRDQQYFEANLERLKTPVQVVWGEKDIYIDKKMGEEFAAKSGRPFSILPGLGHYAHLQAPRQISREIRAAFD